MHSNGKVSKAYLLCFSFHIMCYCYEFGFLVEENSFTVQYVSDHIWFMDSVTPADDLQRFLVFKKTSVLFCFKKCQFPLQCYNSLDLEV